jgi:hypothetical protein
MRSLPILILILAAGGCDSCQPPPDRREAPAPGRAEVETTAPPPEKPGRKVHRTMPAVLQEATVVERSGEVEVDRSETTRKTPGLAERSEALFVGDSVSTGGGGSVKLDVGHETHLTLGPSSSLTIGVHRPLELVLHRGRADLSGPLIRGYTRRFKLMTPGGAVFYAGPGMSLAVADDGAVRVDVTDCPVEPPKPKSLSEGKPPEDRRRCAFIAEDEETFLVTGDRLVVEPGLKIALSSMEDDAPQLSTWLAERNERFAQDQSGAVSAFAAWVGGAADQVGEDMEEVSRRRRRNKELIHELRDLRKAGKAEATENVESAAGPAAEIEKVKDQLRENSAAQYRLRLVLLARFHQVVLQHELLAEHLTDETLEPSGTTVEELARTVETLREKLAGLIQRRPRRKLPPKKLPSPVMKRLIPPPKKPAAGP